METKESFEQNTIDIYGDCTDISSFWKTFIKDYIKYIGKTPDFIFIIGYYLCFILQQIKYKSEDTPYIYLNNSGKILETLKSISSLKKKDVKIVEIKDFLEILNIISKPVLYKNFSIKNNSYKFEPYNYKNKQFYRYYFDEVLAYDLYKMLEPYLDVKSFWSIYKSC